jgi:hypothetical protein
VSQPYEPPQQDLRAAAPAEYPELQGPPETFGLNAAGVPVPMPVPADFAAEHERQMAFQLTPEEIAEFRALRADAKKRAQEAADEAAAAAARLQPATHFVHLADGSIGEGSPIETHVDTGHGIYPVAGAFLKPEFVTFP